MAYAVGIDLGTTFTAAAVADADGIRMVGLTHDRVAIPSLVATGDERMLIGDETALIGATAPWEVAREFKRRFGDPTPMLVAGEARTPDELTGHLLRWVMDRVEELEGGTAAEVVLTHPATWGAHRQDLLRSTATEQGLTDVALLSEPAAAAVHYHARHRVADGATIAVYDLGGGTFDATILQRVGPGYELRGAARGLDRVGGVDLDDVVFRLVVEGLGAGFEELDQDDPTAQRAVARLREECTRAKIGLSYDTKVIVPVVLPGVVTEILLQRVEFERAIAPLIDETIAATGETIESADIGHLDAVLLVGGSSRVPIIGQRLAETLGVDVVVDSHPKHAVALGAAASTKLSGVGAEREVSPPADGAVAPDPEPVPAEVQELPEATVTIDVDMVAAELSRRFVTILSGPRGGFVIDLVDGETVLGRGDDGTVIGLGNRLVSRRHVSFDRRGSVVTVADLGSTNGTTVDGRPLGPEPVPVEPGTVVDVAGTLVMVDGPGARLEPVPVVVDSWTLPPPVPRSGLAGRLRRRGSDSDWLEALRSRAESLDGHSARLRRARRFERPGGAVLATWRRVLPERVTGVSPTAWGTAVIGWADLPSLLDLDVASRVSGRAADDAQSLVGAATVDPLVPLVVPLVATTTALFHRGPEADAMVRSIVTELTLTAPGLNVDEVADPVGAGRELRIGRSLDQPSAPGAEFTPGRILLDPESSAVPSGAATISMVDDRAVYRSVDGRETPFIPATLRS